MIEYNPKRWAPQLLAVRGSIAPKIILRVGLFLVWTIAVVLLHRNVRPIEIPPTVHGLIGVALGLLLVFRTNSSYDRYWEGRKVWGAILNDARNISRATRMLLPGESAIIRPTILWTAVFPYACMHTLRGTKGLGPLESLLPEAHVRKVLASPHVPLAVAEQITAALADRRPPGTFAERAVMAIDNTVRSMVNHIGECERIQNTPLPFAYVVHLRRALVLYLLTLPFALVDTFGWTTVLYTFLISYTLLGIDEIGVEIENPFGTDHNDLPLEHICEVVRRDLLTDDVISTPSLGASVEKLTP